MEEYIYKFYAPTEYSFDALEKRYFWFSNPRYLNDPFDCNYDSFQSSNVFKNLSEEYRNRLLPFNEEMGICSFTRSFENQHFWSLYADNYKGFCLVFDKSVLELRLSKLAMPIRDVEYIDRSQFDFDAMFKKEFKESEDFKIAFDRALSRSAILKNRETWSTEEELRSVLGRIPMDGNNNIQKEAVGYKVPYSPSTPLVEVIMGHNMSPEHKQKIKQIVASKYPTISIKQEYADVESWSIKKKEL